MNKTDILKNQFIPLFRDNLCNVSKTCKQLDITRQCFYSWIDLDSVFEQRINNIKASMIDKAEENILNAIDEGNLKASMFLLTTLGKNRGYSTKQIIEASNKKEIVFSFNDVDEPKQLNDPDVIDIEVEPIDD